MIPPERLNRMSLPQLVELNRRVMALNGEAPRVEGEIGPELYESLLRGDPEPREQILRSAVPLPAPDAPHVSPPPVEPARPVSDEELAALCASVEAEPNLPEPPKPRGPSCVFVGRRARRWIAHEVGGYGWSLTS